MSNKKYEDSCFLSKAQDKRSSNSPDYYGQVEISEETLRWLAGQRRAGEEGKLRVALWRKENDRGVYLSMQLSVPSENTGRSSQQRGGGGGGNRRVESRQQRPEPAPVDDDFNDEIPF